MAPARRSDPALLLLLAFVFCIAAVSADPVNTTTTFSPESPPEPAEIRLFIPSSGSIHSTQVHEAINGKSGNVFFATSFGLSEYNGSWSTRHLTRGDLRWGLYDDFITAIEYDSNGYLWIGYAGGIQVDNGTSYRTIRDQQLLKSLRIKAFQRWGDSLWVASGNAGIHRFQNGTWTWFKPFSDDGPGFHEVDSMVLDPRSDSLLIATESEGIWRVSSSQDPVSFERIDTSMEIPVPSYHARQDPLGSTYFFDEQGIERYSADTGWEHVLSVSDIPSDHTTINDIAAGPDGTLYIGTDHGIHIWRNGFVLRHLSRIDGIGNSAVVTFLFLDAGNRLWFATQENVGYYYGEETAIPVIPVRILNQSAEMAMTTNDTQDLSTAKTPPTYVQAGTVIPKTVLEPSILDSLISFITGLFPKFP